MHTILQKSISIFLWLALFIWGCPLTTRAQVMVLAQNPESFSDITDDMNLEVVDPEDEDEYDAQEDENTSVEIPSSPEQEAVEADEVSEDILNEDLETDDFLESDVEEEPKPSIEPMKTLLDEEPQFQFEIPADADPEEITGLNEEVLKEDPREDLQEAPLREFDINNDLQTTPLLKYGIHDDLQNSHLLKYELKFSGKEANKLTEKGQPFGKYPKKGIAPKVGTRGYWDVPYKKTKKTTKDLDKDDLPKEAEFAH